MQSAHRHFERGVVPVAILALVAIVGVGAFAVNSMHGAGNRNAHLASVLAVNFSVPSGALEGTRCVNDNYIKITVGTSQGAQPTAINENRGTATNPDGSDRPGCYARFCSGRIGTQNNPATEACTQYRHFETEEAMRQVNGATTNNQLATTMFGQGFVSDLQNSGTNAGTGELLRGLPHNTSSAITDAFRAEQVSAMDAFQDARQDGEDALENLRQCSGTDCDAYRAELNEAVQRAEQEEQRLASLRNSAQSLVGTQGIAELESVQPERTPALQGRDLDTCVRGTAGCPNTDGPTTFGGQQDAAERQCQGNPTCLAAVREARNQQYNPSDQRLPPIQTCSTWQRMIGGCSNVNSGFGGLFGGNQQQQCGYYNGQYVCYNTGQCGGLQQMISGCPNPFNRTQQQCGGLMALLSKCPAGSYNPNNPSNPYNYPAPTCSIRVTPTSVSAAGEVATLQWQSQNASYAYLSNSGQVGPSGSMPVYPQGPTTYVMTTIGYGNQQGRCETSVGVGAQTGSGQVKAEISCQPQIAEIGTSIAVTWGCQNAATSAGSGFSTAGTLSGTTSVTLAAPTLGSTTNNFGLTCSNQGVTHSAQCTINVNKPAIVLVANPKTIRRGEKSTIGWVTSGMNSCVVSSSNEAFTAENAGSTNVSGTARTPTLSADTPFTLTCQTKTGTTKTAATTVVVQN